MAREFQRMDRVQRLISRQLATLIHHEINDPRIPMVSLSEVRVSRDLGRATIYFTCLGDAKANAKAQNALNHASVYLRHLLAQRVTLRNIPALHFIYDVSQSKGAALNTLIDQSLVKHQSFIKE